MLPRYDPAERPLGLTEIIKVAGVVPVDGVTDSQLPPPPTTVEKLIAGPELFSATVCELGRAPPIV